MWSVNQADVIEWANAYKGEPFHALLCDAPYEYGFMGKSWDATGISYRVETWAAYWRILYPGAFGMAFGGARTAHRIAVAVEDAGFIIHPMMGWIYGSGFPKATRLDTRIDKDAGAEREIVGEKLLWGHNAGSGAGSFSHNQYEGQTGITRSEPITAPATDLARAWAGHRYGLQALKPALEPIIVFQKPYDGKPLESITRTGAGAFNIDGSRIGTEAVISNRWKDDAHPFGGGAGNEYETVHNSGRWPANVVLSHSPDCTPDSCACGCAVAAMGEQSGTSFSSGGRSGHDAAYGGGYKQEYYGDNRPGLGDTGTAARFFYNADWMYERLEQDNGFCYCAKANRTERDAGLDAFDYRWRGNPDGAKGDNTLKGPGNALHPDKNAQVRNHHPAVKPISLCQHLATLLLPPGLYVPRRIVVPFSGSGSEMIGCMRAGWEEIHGIEREAEYSKIADARLKYWSKIPIQREFVLNP